MKDPKDVYNEAYANAVEDGNCPEVAHDIAEEARIDAESSLIDDAMNRLRETRDGCPQTNYGGE